MQLGAMSRKGKEGSLRGYAFLVGFIERTLQQQVNDTYWIGLHRDGDVWRWVDEEYYNSSLFKFKVQSPERCTLMTKSGYYQDDCNRKYGTICLKKAAKIDLS
ncbi:killer cell lectin-like receptor subfamily F member 2 [Ranitomeya variabilis]|uniref:killer cell lectin-like receptor subfamily F member 2 n=1 Tax=Ranitomeya variabilis TaxID=490064 RepID=UPI0040576C8F